MIAQDITETIELQFKTLDVVTSTFAHTNFFGGSALYDNKKIYDSEELLMFLLDADLIIDRY